MARDIGHLIEKCTAEANALETGIILGKMKVDPSSVSVEEFGRIYLEYVLDPDEKF